MSAQALDRRDLFTGLAGVGALLIANNACGQQPPPHEAHAEHGGKDAPPAPQPTGALQAVTDSTAACTRDGRFCLARCTEHLAAGETMMQGCQRAVMNMLALVGAMGDVAGYRNADPKNIRALASACAAFCRACADACQPHSQHHAECKACMDSCLACAKACETLAAG